MIANNLVKFDKTKHEYYLGDKKLQGVTPIVSWMFPKTYDGIPGDVLQRAAEYGTAVHSHIEIYDTLGLIPDEGDEIIKAYLALREQQGLETLYNEFLVSDNEHIASSIDLVMKDKNHDIVLCDIKTTSQLHTENVTLQLSIYAYLFEMQTKRRVGRLMVMWLPRPQYGKPVMVEVQRIPSDQCAAVITAYLANEDPTPYREKLFPSMVQKTWDAYPVALAEIERSIYKIEAEAKRLKQESDKLRAGLLQIMLDNELSNYDGELIKVSLRKATTRKEFDKTRFAKEHPEIYNEYIMYTNVKESITIKLK